MSTAATLTLSRRGFLAATAGAGGLILGFSLPGFARELQATASDDSANFNAFVAIDSDGIVTMQMPFIVRYPGKTEPGSRNDWLINNTDFAPTILDLAGLETPEYMQGKSFVAALNGENEPGNWRKATYYRYWMHMAHGINVPAHFGIRTKKYKLIFYLKIVD